MSRYILSLNCGSSSVKFNLFEIRENNTLRPDMEGIVEEIGNIASSRLRYLKDGKKHEIKSKIRNHGEALRIVFDEFKNLSISIENICGVGHRVVHGGDKYKNSVRIDLDVINTIRDLIPIAPLHNPPNLTGIEESMKLLPDVPQVAVFDTAFHGTIPEYAFRYAIPERWYKDFGVRKYGFHGTSHMYVARKGARVCGVPFKKFNCITAHLGNGSSITKVQNGESVDTSMGFTPLEGVVMGTRSGDIDPALIQHVSKRLCEEEGMDEADAYNRVMKALNKESGLKALGNTNMMQHIREKAVNGDMDSEIVVDIYTYRVAKYIGQYWATLPYTNAIIFTAGLGENEGYVRAKIMNYLQALKIKINDENNAKRKQQLVIGKSSLNPEVPLSVMVIPTDEEIVIGYDTLYLGYLGDGIPEVYPFES